MSLNRDRSLETLERFKLSKHPDPGNTLSTTIDHWLWVEKELQNQTAYPTAIMASQAAVLAGTPPDKIKIQQYLPYPEAYLDGKEQIRISKVAYHELLSIRFESPSDGFEAWMDKNISRIRPN